MSLRKNIAAFFIIGILGTLAHFVYEWTNENYIVGLFFPVSESTWEHLKLLFYPTIIYSVAEYLLLKEKPANYISAVVISLLCGMFSIVAIYYVYTGILGRNIDFINVLVFFISIIIMLFKKNKLLQNKKYSIGIFNIFFLSIALIFAILFAVWSYNPPSLGIFRLT